MTLVVVRAKRRGFIVPIVVRTISLALSFKEWGYLTHSLRLGGSRLLHQAAGLTPPYCPF